MEHRRAAFRDYMAAVAENSELKLANLPPVADFYEHMADWDSDEPKKMSLMQASSPMTNISENKQRISAMEKGPTDEDTERLSTCGQELEAAMDTEQMNRLH